MQHFCFCPISYELNSNIKDFYVHKRPISLRYWSQICLNSEHFSFAEIIHPLHRCGISRRWLDSMITAQVCLRLATKGHYKMCSFITKHNATDVASFEGACNWHADCRNVQFLQTVWNFLREAHLHARRPHRSLDLTAVHHRNWLEWANAHIRWRLTPWRGVLFTDESRFSLYRADGRQREWRRVGERFANVNVVDRVAHGGGGVMVWAGVCYGQRTQVHFIDGILNAQRYRDEILRPIVVPFIHDHHLMLQQLHTAIEEERTNIPQATINNLNNSIQRRCVALREANGSHTRYRLVFGPPQYSKLHILEWSFIVASLRHTCAIIMLSNQHLDSPSTSHVWHISANKVLT